MKKLWISIGMALGLLAAPAMTMAQETPRTPLSNLSFVSRTGTFTDLASYDKDAENAFTLTHYIKLGEDLAPGAALRDVFFVGDAEKTGSSDNNLADMFKTVTIDNGVAADSAERIQVAIPAMQAFGKAKFSYLYADMQGFVISALGGILFADGKTTAEDTKSVTCLCPQVKGWLTADQKELLRVIPCNTSGTALEPTKGTDAPVILAIGTDAEGLFIWTQFDYMVGDARWLFQIRYHENGLTDYIVGNDLGRSVLSEGATSVFAPIAIQTKGNDRLQAYILGPNTNASPAPGANCWELPLLRMVNTKEAFEITPTCGPEPGHTISIIPHVSAASFNMAGDLTIEPARLAGKVVFDPAGQATALGVVEGLYLAVSPYEDPAWFWSATDKLPTLDYESNYGRFVYISDAQPSDQQPLEMAFDAQNLTSNTDYYIHAMTGHRNLDKWSNVSYATYSVAVFGPYKSAIPGVEDVTATVTDGHINLTFKPAEDLATMVVKSQNVTPKKPNGNLKVNDLIGYTYEVRDTVALLLEPETGTAVLSAEAGESFFLHFYSVLNKETEEAVYSGATTVPVHRPAETLPIDWNFSQSAYPNGLPDNTTPMLPAGWNRTPLTGTTDPSIVKSAFYTRYGYNGYELISRKNPHSAYEVDVITPAFISPEDRIQATFYIRFYNSPDDYQFTPTSSNGNSIRIEYRTDGGQWTEILSFDQFPAYDNHQLIPLTAAISGVKGKLVEMRYIYQSPEDFLYPANGIVSVHVEKGRACNAPVLLAVDNDKTTDAEIPLTWSDLNTTATAFTIRYQATSRPDEKPTIVTLTDKKHTLTGLKPNTTYQISVQATCGLDSSLFCAPVIASTYAGLPYEESLGEKQLDPNNPGRIESPADRGVITYRMSNASLLPETNPTYVWSTRHSSSALNGGQAAALAVHEGVESNITMFTLPEFHTSEPGRLTFTLNSFSAKKDAEYRPTIVPGARPTEDDCELFIILSDNGTFSTENPVLSLKGENLNVIDSVFQLDIPQTGRFKLAFLFSNPQTHWEDDFYLEAYNLSFTAIPPTPEEYTLSLTVSPAEGGTVTGAGKHTEGSDITITATPNEGFDFVAWMNGETRLSTTASYTFKMPAADAAYTAVFKSNKPDEPEEEYELTLTASPANGGRVSGAGLYLTGEEVTISAEANQGFKFVAWLNDTDTLSKEATHTFKMPEGDLSLTAKFIVETANEDAVKASFGVSTRDGRVHVRNLGGMTVNTVEIYTLTGNRLHRFTPNSREDLILPVDAERALLFIRIDAENGTAVYKVYLH